LPGQIGSIERAIVLLGLNAVKNIAVAASLGQLFRGVKLCEGFTAKDLWTHCIAVGVTARQFAKELKFPIADEAFLAGMIHDIGIMVSLQTAPEQLKQVCERAKQTNTDFCQIEREVMGVDHQQLGQALAEAWKFPRPCQLVAGFHHQPAQLADGNRSLVTLVHVADTVCAQEGQGFNLTAVHQAIDDQLLQSVGLDAGTVDRVRKSLPELMNSAARLG
jgi:HD-like signal output (HDOD) protein